MYLKQLILRGFKSFASATTLNFEPGITCIVGPNGSGKSNVVDALSWVMGEQGAKSLRGGKMEDVIFAGTPKRAPLGRAEVQLTIDNSDGALPIEYSEVTITRTMFRSGGSEYAINGVPSRLLDVTELLSDSGIGREMHVIVGQGQLDAILQATPESRRGFIEEAAGVLKHRKRKEKAVRKLEGTRANLERLQDLIGELQRQLKPLGRQAEAARRAAVIQAEQRDAKARLLADDLHAAREALAADLADEAAATEAKERAEAEARAAMAAEEAAEVELKEAARDFDRCQERWYALAALKERVSSTISVAAERMRHGDAQPAIEASGRDPDALEAEAREVRQRETELADDIERARSTLREASERRSEAETRHTEAEQAYAAALRVVADRREGLARLKGQVASVRSRLEAGQGEQERLAARREEALTRAREAADQYRQAENTLAGLGTDESSLDSAWEAANNSVTEHEAEVARLVDEGTRLARDKAALTARVDALRLATRQRDGSTDLLGCPGCPRLGTGRCDGPRSCGRGGCRHRTRRCPLGRCAPGRRGPRTIPGGCRRCGGGGDNTTAGTHHRTPGTDGGAVPAAGRDRSGGGSARGQGRNRGRPVADRRHPGGGPGLRLAGRGRIDRKTLATGPERGPDGNRGADGAGGR